VRRANVRFGSLANTSACQSDLCFTFKSGHTGRQSARLLCAMCGRIWTPDLAMSRPTVVTTCMLGSSKSWLHQQQPYSWHSRAGGGAVHSSNSGLMRSHRHGIAWAQRTIRSCARQCDKQGADAHENPGDGLSLNARVMARASGAMRYALVSPRKKALGRPVGLRRRTRWNSY
jgi:hypothetical protein